MENGGSCRKSDACIAFEGVAETVGIDCVTFPIIVPLLREWLEHKRRCMLYARKTVVSVSFDMPCVHNLGVL